MIEGFLEARLAEEVEGFSMDRFGGMLADRQDEITGDVFDMLMSFTEFDEFKDLMLSYKGETGRATNMNLDGCLGIVSKENRGAVGSGVLGLAGEAGTPQKGGRSEGGGSGGGEGGGVAAVKNRDAFDPLSPASREAKDAGVSP